MPVKLIVGAQTTHYLSSFLLRRRHFSGAMTNREAPMTRRDLPGRAILSVYCGCVYCIHDCPFM